MKEKKVFTGDRKFGYSILLYYENKFRDWLVSIMPRFIETYHLTLACIPASLLALIGGWLAQVNLNWLWLSTIGVTLHYIFDLSDGALGRVRGTGLIKWGFYTDHLIDYFFLACVMGGYLMLVPDRYDHLVFSLMVIWGAFMVNSFLSFATVNQFQTYYYGIGPTEIRVLMVIINTLTVVFGTRILIDLILPGALIISTISLIFLVFQVQKRLWKNDMEAKKQQNPL